MQHLAKIGFSQSYSYFTWRNTKEELEEYFTELTQTEVRDYMRPNLFANTPDILHEYLQTGGRPAFQARLVLAATLGANYGIYSGFELCENVPVKPGSEEYLDSEKYQIRPRDFRRARQPRRADRARQRDPPRASARSSSTAASTFHETDNEQLICYTQAARLTATDPVLVVVNLDPLNMQHGHVKLPLVDWKLPLDSTRRSHDLLVGRDLRLARRVELRAPRSPDRRRARHRASPVANRQSAAPSSIDNRQSPIANGMTTGTRTRSSTRRTSAPSSTATTTASATFPG